MELVVGMIFPFYGIGNDIPAGLQPCDGRRFNSGQFPLLFSLLIRSANNDLLKLDPRLPYSDKNKLPDGVMRVPDLRGVVVRGLYTADPQNDPPKPMKDPNERTRGLGSEQWDAVQHHQHDFDRAIKVQSGGQNHGISGGSDSEQNIKTRQTLVQDLNDSGILLPGSTFVGPETRGRNIAVTLVICAEEKKLISKGLLEVWPDPRGPVPAAMVAAAKRKYPRIQFSTKTVSTGRRLTKR